MEINFHWRRKNLDQQRISMSFLKLMRNCKGLNLGLITIDMCSKLKSKTKIGEFRRWYVSSSWPFELGVPTWVTWNQSSNLNKPKRKLIWWHLTWSPSSYGLSRKPVKLKSNGPNHGQPSQAHFASRNSINWVLHFGGS